LAAGAMVPAVKRRGLLGNAWRGESDVMVMEADESDGTLTKYRPELGVLLNVTKDHKEVSELLELFRTFKRQSKRFVVNAALAEFAPGARTYRLGETALTPFGSSFSHEGAAFKLNVPGRHNAENALAAAVACLELGVPLKRSAEALETYETIGRRFESVGRKRGVEVIDDFAHNPEKVRASWAAAKLRGKRVLAVFQLHGFAPARFMKDDFAAAFRELLGERDALWLPDIYYVGGTAAKDIFATDYVKALQGKRAFHAPDRPRMIQDLAAEAREGDVILVMGARDPSLSALAASILQAL
jgi:UDP-N-acetylmuramate-alanine ligase